MEHALIIKPRMTILCDIHHACIAHVITRTHYTTVFTISSHRCNHVYTQDISNWLAIHVLDLIMKVLNWCSSLNNQTKVSKRTVWKTKKQRMNASHSYRACYWQLNDKKPQHASYRYYQIQLLQTFLAKVSASYYCFAFYTQNTCWKLWKWFCRICQWRISLDVSSNQAEHAMFKLVLQWVATMLWDRCRHLPTRLIL